MSATQATLKRYEMLIDGEFVASAKMLTVVNPATEEVISEFPCGTAEDANRAVLAAEKAQKAWAALPAIRRAAHLRETERQRHDDIVKEIRSVLNADAKAAGYTLVLDVSGDSANTDKPDTHRVP